MPLRETMNEKPALVGGIVAGIVALAIVLWIVLGRSGGGGDVGGVPERAFFTVDDGKTWFAAETTNIPPFDHDGKQAVKAYVYACGGKTFVSHLERATPEGRKIMQAEVDAVRAGKPSVHKMPTGGVALNEIKRPGGAAWIAQNDKAKSGAILAVKCPDGSTGDATPVTP